MGLAAVSVGMKVCGANKPHRKRLRYVPSSSDEEAAPAKLPVSEEKPVATPTGQPFQVSMEKAEVTSSKGIRERMQESDVAKLLRLSPYLWDHK